MPGDESEGGILPFEELSAPMAGVHVLREVNAPSVTRRYEARSEAL